MLSLYVFVCLLVAGAVATLCIPLFLIVKAINDNTSALEALAAAVEEEGRR